MFSFPETSFFDSSAPDVLDHMWVGWSQAGNISGCMLAPDGMLAGGISEYVLTPDWT